MAEGEIRALDTAQHRIRTFQAGGGFRSRQIDRGHLITTTQWCSLEWKTFYSIYPAWTLTDKSVTWF